MSTCGGLMDFLPANFMLQVPNNNDQQFPSSLASVLPTCTPQDFHAGFAPMVGKRLMPHAGIDVFQEVANGGGGSGSGEEDNLSDDGSQAGEKKRRLNMEQVKTLESNFELGNKLDPERKMQLAKALGLQPRQIAIWFQNRRARWKTKQLEKHYVILKRQFESLKADNESLLAQNHKLQSEISTFKGREPTESINLNKETDQCCSSNKSENSTDIKLDISTRTTTMKIAIAATERSPFSSHPTRTTAFFPPPPSSSFTINQTNGTTTPLIQNPPDLHCQKFDQGFTNMFSGIDDQSAFWPLLEQHNYN